MKDEQFSVISIDQVDAVELIELLEFVEAWLASSGPTINEAYRRFVGMDAYPLTALRADLLSWAARLALAPAKPH
jgi:hypothetical protein